MNIYKSVKECIKEKKPIRWKLDNFDNMTYNEAIGVFNTMLLLKGVNNVNKQNTAPNKEYTI